MTPDLPHAPRPDLGPDEPLVVELDGFEGPLDVLLALARTQKVDVTRLSILRLADQYLEFIAEARRLSLEVAADYLVMAAWLAYLKSRSLLPAVNDDEEEYSGQELAARLAFRLQRLDAMRNVAARLMKRERLGRDVFRRGMPEGVRNIRHAVWEVSLFELLSAYGGLKRGEPEPWRMTRVETYSLEEALARLTASLGMAGGWERLESFLPPGVTTGFQRRSAVASTLLAGLEMSRQGKATLRQERPWGPIYVKSRRPGDS